MTATMICCLSTSNPFGVARFNSVRGLAVMKVDIDPDDLITRGTDSRGRITLGGEYADRDSITVAVVDDPEADQ